MGRELEIIITIDWLKKKGDNLLCKPTPTEAETILELFLEARLHFPYKSHIMVVPRLMIFLWRKYMGKEADLIFTVPVGIPF